MPIHWQAQISQSLNDPNQLLTYLDLDPKDFNLAKSPFPFRVTHAFASRMEKGNPHDPLLLQVIPLQEECLELEQFVQDPVMDLASALSPGVIQKYAGRILLITTGACAIHCRYCFRREYPYISQKLTRSSLLQNIALFRENPEIHEVILSGGDPLTLSNERIQEIIDLVSDVSHIRTIRFHTRLPIVLPDRIDRELVAILSAARTKIVIVIHSNHPRELDESVLEALRTLQMAGVVLLNQTVLLRRINDDPSILIALSRRLFEMGVLPYYLHELDKARGTSHFEVKKLDSKDIIEAMRNALPGYLVPRLVREIPGEPSKTLLG